jgi:hypothetical protein
MATEAPAIPNPNPKAAAAPAAKQHLLIPGGEMARLANRAAALRAGAWHAAWRLAVLEPTRETFEGLALNPAASLERGLRWVLIGAAAGWGIPAMTILLRTTAPLFTVILAYLLGVGATLMFFALSTAAAHVLAERAGARAEFGGLAFACAAFAAPLTPLAGLLLSASAVPGAALLALLPLAALAGVWAGLAGW